MLCISDVDGYFKLANPAFLKTLGYTEKKLTKYSYLNLVHPDDLESTKIEIKKLSKGSPVINFENRYRCQDGSYKWLHWTSNVILDEQLTYSIARDITEKKQSQEALKESYYYLNSIFRAVPGGVGLIKDRVFKEVNDHICQITGYRREELIDQNARLLYPSDEEYDFVGQEKYRQIQEKGTGTVETRYQCKDGHVIDVLLSSTPLDINDCSKGVTFTVTDISAIKQSTLALHQSNEKYLDLYENAPDMYINVEPKSTNIIQCNQTLVNILGFTKEEIIGHSILNLYTPESAKYVKEIIIPIFIDKGIVSNENLKIKKKNGDIIDVSLNMTAARDEQGNILHSRAIWRDISALIEMQKVLKDKSERLEIAIDGTHDGLWVWDIESGHEWHALQWKTLLGFNDNDEINDHVLSWESRVHPDDKERVLNNLNQHLEQNATYDCEQRLRTKSNEYKWFRDRGKAIRDGAGKAIRMGGSIQDISKLKKAEERLEKLNKELEILSMQDGLTGIANRRMFDQLIEQEWLRSHRSKQPLSLILIDIDLFKTYNDTYGHVAGDECLKKIAKTLSNVIKRPSDLVARYGGEEFVILLPETDAIHANHLAEECCKKILDQQIPHEKLDVNSYVTISLGVCTTIPDAEKQLLSLLELADKALYQAKNNGRNQVVSIEFSNHE